MDAYSAQSAFYHYGIYSLCDVAAYFAPVHADDKEDVMTLLKVIFPEGFHAYLETLVGSVYTKSTALLLWNGDHSSLGVQQGHDVCIQRTE